MKQLTSWLQTFIKSIEDFSIFSIELVKLFLIRKFAKVVSFMAAQLIIGLLLLSGFLFANITLALWLGSITGKMYYGFLLVTGFCFLLFTIATTFCKKGIRKYIINYLIKHLI